MRMERRPVVRAGPDEVDEVVLRVLDGGAFELLVVRPGPSAEYSVRTCPGSVQSGNALGLGTRDRNRHTRASISAREIGMDSPKYAPVVSS